MIDTDIYQNYAADCVRQADVESEPEDKNIMLNLALAWVRLAQQTRLLGEPAEAGSATNIASDPASNYESELEESELVQ